MPHPPKEVGAFCQATFYFANSATIYSSPQQASALGADELGRELLIDFGQPLWIETAMSLHFVYGPEIGLVAARDGPLKQPGGRRANVLERMRCAARSKNEIAGDNRAFLASDHQRDGAL